MKSEFEKHAAQEAVEASERRWWRAHGAEIRALERRRLVRVLALWLIVVFSTVAGILFWWCFSGENGLSYRAAMSFDVWGGDGMLQTHERNHYGDVLKLMLSGDLKLSSEMPEALKIKKAEAGERYVVLTPPAGDWFGLYELTRMPGDVAVNELSPVASPRQVKAAALQAACAGKPYLVAVRGQVYLFGSTDPKDAERLRNRVRALVGTDRERKE